MSSGTSGERRKAQMEGKGSSPESGGSRRGTWSIYALEGLAAVLLLSVLGQQAAHLAGEGASRLTRSPEHPRRKSTAGGASPGDRSATPPGGAAWQRDLPGAGAGERQPRSVGPANPQRLAETAAGRTGRRGSAVPVTGADVWLARCIYAETNRLREQELVAWVVRNRVETRFRGRETYRGVVLDPGQFTPFNPGAPRRSLHLGLAPGSTAPGWKQALTLARAVRRAPAAARPFPPRVRHFYSPQSMPGGRPPSWAVGRRPVAVRRPYEIDPSRFRFFENVPPDS